MKEKVITQMTRMEITIIIFTKPMFRKINQVAIQNPEEEKIKDEI